MPPRSETSASSRKRKASKRDSGNAAPEAPPSQLDKWMNVWMDNDCDISAVPPEHRLGVLEADRAIREQMEKMMPQMGGLDQLLDDPDMHPEERAEIEAMQRELAELQEAAHQQPDQPTEKSASAKAYEAVLDGLNGQMFMFEQPYDEAIPTAESVLKKEHILLPKVSGMIADRLYKEMLEVTDNHMGGGTSLGNKIWWNFLIPSMRNISEMVRKTEYQLALGELFGLLMFSVYGDDGWLMDNEVWMDDEFGEFFKSLGQSWKAVLAKSDTELGLADKKYRKKIKSMLKEFTATANDALSNYDDVEFKFKV